MLYWWMCYLGGQYDLDEQVSFSVLPQLMAVLDSRSSLQGVLDFDMIVGDAVMGCSYVKEGL